ncbi:MAG TPA: hypothetical protein ENJ22_05225 [Gammaproteobacteria bacterium]|nr:hypothetical protein [Gammaproteobacteria bacterium]
MYCKYFGLRAHPFKITPDIRLFYSGARRGAILDALKYSILSGEGIVKMVGEVGSGKTMLCRTLIQALPLSVEVAYLANPGLSRLEVLRAISQELGLPETPAHVDRLELLNRLHHHLITLHGEGCRVVIIVEEAQGMPLETLEELRFLANLETHREKLLQILLIGQPELDQRLATPEIRQLRDRITQNFALPILSRDEVRDYIHFRLHAVGCTRVDLFTAAALRLLTIHSGGLLRRLHILADKALLAAYADGSLRVTRAHVHRAVDDSEYAREGRTLVRRFLPAGVGMAFALAGLVSYAVTPVLETTARQVAPSVTAESQHPASPVAMAEQPVSSDGQAEPARRLEGRIAHTREWLHSTQGGYTIQVMLTEDNDPSGLVRLVAESAPEYVQQLYIYPARVRGSERWSVVYGAYPDFAAAQAALREIPALFQANGPFIRSLKSIRKEATHMLALATAEDTP